MNVTAAALVDSALTQVFILYSPIFVVGVYLMFMGMGVAPEFRPFEHVENDDVEIPRRNRVRVRRHRKDKEDDDQIYDLLNEIAAE